MPPFYLILTVTLPYTRSEFNSATQVSYKVAISKAAGTTADLVDILSISEARRADSAAINVETKIRAPDAASLSAIESNLGSGEALKAKVNAALKEQGLRESKRIEVATVTATTASGSRQGTTYLITGASIGGVVVLLLLLIAAAVVYRRKREASSSAATAAHDQSEPIREEGGVSRTQSNVDIVSVTTQAAPPPMPSPPAPAWP